MKKQRIIALIFVSILAFFSWNIARFILGEEESSLYYSLAESKILRRNIEKRLEKEKEKIELISVFAAFINKVTSTNSLFEIKFIEENQAQPFLGGAFTMLVFDKSETLSSVNDKSHTEFFKLAATKTGLFHKDGSQSSCKIAAAQIERYFYYVPVSC